ncbi:hypothetical protein [Indioceanicola profundi]|uniref:hypothetical protein n=1 Tax=Indioceanicola profundi TaxID=2220096 RepID=UPI000E6ABEC1|nr:hypothetical protein [Indioceanicola profundi]
MSAGLIFALLIALAVFGWRLERAMAQVAESKRRYRALMAKRQAQVDRLKKSALETLYLKREHRHTVATRDGLMADCDRLEAEIRHIARPANRVFVLDERRMPSDRTWLLHLSAPAGDAGRSAPWTGVRRFQVWAVDEEAARAKALRRFPESQGYRIAALKVVEGASAPAAQAAAG